MAPGGRARREPDEFPISGYGRQRLLDTAEQLFDSLGFEVSARSIAQAAGHRNVAAVSYHFGTKEDLVRAVLLRRAEAIDAVRHRLLTELEAAGPVDPADALAAMLEPLVDLLDDEGGRRYLRLLNQAANHPAYYQGANVGFSASLSRGAVHLAPLLAHLPEHLRAHRAQLALGMVLYGLAEQARLLDADTPVRPALDRETFRKDLLASALAVLRAD